MKRIFYYSLVCIVTSYFLSACAREEAVTEVQHATEKSSKTVPAPSNAVPDPESAVSAPAEAVPAHFDAAPVPSKAVPATEGEGEGIFPCKEKVEPGIFPPPECIDASE